MDKALFLDLDDAVIKTRSGEKYPKNFNDWEFREGILTLIRAFSQRGYIIILISNQGGIGAGKIDALGFDQKFDRVREEIADYIGIGVDGLYCPHLDDRNYYRMPNPGMAYKAALGLELSLRDSIVVGNSNAVSKFAKNAYIGTYYDREDFIQSNRVDI